MNFFNLKNNAEAELTSLSRCVVLLYIVNERKGTSFSPHRRFSFTPVLSPCELLLQLQVFSVIQPAASLLGQWGVNALL